MKGQGFVSLRWVGFLLFLSFPLAGRGATRQLDPSDPVGFFTNLASRLLQSEFNLNLTRIQIYPTNQYTPAVHRLLQVAANIYEATTNRFNDDYPHLPTVFRPRFTHDGGSVYITGYVEETNSAFLGSPLRDLISTNVANAVQPDDRILGVPPILGAKKGLPNFNEFSAEAVISITRKVELRRPSLTSPVNETNQMFVIGISNVFGAEFWNSYLTNFPRPVEVLVTNLCSLSLTNDFGYHHLSNLMAYGFTNVSAWPAWRPNLVQPRPPWSFVVPLRSNHIIIPDSAYQHSTASFAPITSTFERLQAGELWFPRWGLTITNRLVAIIKEPGDDGRIIDYVQLSDMITQRSFSLDLAESPLALQYFGNGAYGVWATNSPDGVHLGDSPGIDKQIRISMGNVLSDLDWINNSAYLQTSVTKNQAIANFLYFMRREPYYQANDGTRYYGTNTGSGLVAVAPFMPTSKRSIPYIWQANDPLVHYLTSDLQYLENSGVAIPWTPPTSTIQTLPNLGRLNARYRPWGNYPNNPEGDSLAFNIGLKDAGVTKSGDWQFPTDTLPAVGWMGRIHRGTPWQTIYLKSTDLDLRAWQNWTGNLDANDAQHARPARDWPLVSLLMSLLNTNDPRQLVSVNEPNTDIWLAVLDGIVALTNSATDDALVSSLQPQFDYVTMTSNSPQAAILAAAIHSARAAQGNQRFNGLAALLAVPELSVASPWLNRSSDVQLRFGINDEAYEAIPVQLLERLRPDSAGSILPDSGAFRIQFSGFDNYPYGVESSSDLVDWLPLSINFPTNGVFEFIASPIPGDTQRFYRSVLLP